MDGLIVQNTSHAQHELDVESQHEYAWICFRDLMNAFNEMPCRTKLPGLELANRNYLKASGFSSEEFKIVHIKFKKDQLAKIKSSVQ